MTTDLQAAVRAAVEKRFPPNEQRTVLAAGVPVAICLTRVGADNLTTLVCRVLSLHGRESSDRWVIGISGPAGAGKSTLGGMLVQVLNALHGEDESFSCLLGVDGYHKENSTLDLEGSRAVKGRPATLDVASFVRDVRRVKYQRADDPPVGLPTYHRPSHNPIADALFVPPPPRLQIVVIEGILLFTEGNGFEPLYQDHHNGDEKTTTPPLLDVRIYLDLPEPLARGRVNARKVQGGRRHEDVEEHYLRVDFKNHEEMDRGKKHAHLLLRPSQHDENSYELLS